MKGVANVESNRGFVLSWSALIALLGIAILVAAAGRFTAPQAASTLAVAVALGLLIAAFLATDRAQARLPARQPLLSGGTVMLVVAATATAVTFELVELIPAIGFAIVILAAVILLLYRTRRSRA